MLFGVISLGIAMPVAELLNEEWIEFKVKKIYFFVSNKCVFVIQIVFFTLQLEHSKQYINEDEELFRFKVFLENKYKIAKHNQLYDQKRVSFRLAMNKFGDLLTNEFVGMMNGFNGANVMKWVS